MLQRREQGVLTVLKNSSHKLYVVVSLIFSSCGMASARASRMGRGSEVVVASRVETAAEDRARAATTCSVRSPEVRKMEVTGRPGMTWVAAWEDPVKDER